MEKIFTKEAPQAIGPYSQGIAAAGTVYTSGQIAIDPSTGKNQAAEMAVEKVEEFFYSKLGLKKSLSEIGIGREHFSDMAKKAAECGGGDCVNGWQKLYAADIEKIYEACLN